MNSITFSEIMEFYPEHNHSVYEELRNACQQGKIIPFVGAGLSVFCGYEGWPDVLRKLAKYVYDPRIRANIETMIEDGKLLQAAQKIQNNYPRLLRELKKLIDYDKIKNCDDDKLYASAAYVLPYLFDSSFVMTTNFDRVLEEVYDRCHVKFGNIITPYEPDLLTQSRQNNPHCLFKLHGDIGPEIYDIKQLIFTQTQYDEAYAKDRPLMNELPQWFRSKKLLFLGCSLEQDQTMNVLRQVTSQNPGLDHFAILKCRPEDMSRRCVEMGDLGISAIYYPDERHEAVRVILERLLEEINHNAYEELCRYSKKNVSEPNAQNRFMYDSNYIAFVGRKQEFDQLRVFCQSDKQISWWAVTGPGGMGKSRLIYEFTNAQKNNGWKVFWLKYSEYSNLDNWTPPADRCIVVMDDAQAHFSSVGTWIRFISEYRRSEKLRIILLERDGKDWDSAKWAELLKSNFPYDTTIPSMCHCSDFLNLAPLSDDELKTIMLDFAKASGKLLTDNSYADRLLETLKKIDGDLQRPIYALAITDAWCSGNDPTHWSKEQVLDALANRELHFYYERLRSLSSAQISRATCSELENLLAQSCTMSFFPLNKITDKEYPKLHERADNLELSFPDLLRQIGLVHKKNNIEAIVLDCPDLIKEYFVLRKTLNENRLDFLLPADWDNNFMQLIFLRKILVDYPEQLEGQNPFWEAFCVGNPDPDGLLISLYVDLLVQIAGRFPQRTIQAFDQL